MAFIEVDEPAMLDSTGQAIKNSIDALTTALTTEKANRDASNVTNASAWRSALGIKRKTVRALVASGQITAVSTGLTRNNIVSVNLIYSDDVYYNPVVVTITDDGDIEIRTTVPGTTFSANRTYTFDVIYTE